MPTPTDPFEACLADLDARIDEAQEQANRDAWVDFLYDRCDEEFFVPPARIPAPSNVEWPSSTVNEAQRDIDTMVLQQLAGVSRVIEDGGAQPLTVRCNYGTGIVPTMFGCEVFWMDDETGTLPTARPLGREKVPALLDAGVPDITGGLGQTVLDCAARFQDVFARYPKIGKWVTLYHPDTQGPIDIVEMVWGSEMFLAFYDEPDLMHQFLDLATDTYATFHTAWYDQVPQPTWDCSAHWSCMHKGVLMIRNDSLMNLSAETYVEFVRPRDQKLFDTFGGGAIHFCGRADHYIEAMSEMTGLSGVNLSQPHLNDMETVYRHTVDKGIKLLSFSREWARKAVEAGRPLRGQVQC